MKQQLGEMDVGQIKTKDYQRYNQGGEYPHDPNTNFNTIILFDNKRGCKKIYYDPHVVLGIKQCTWRIKYWMQKWINKHPKSRGIIAW